MYSQNKFIRHINGIYTIISMVLPVLIFFYTIWYFFSPGPYIFTKEFAYEIFPNLKIEYDYLVGIGKAEFAENFVHYQINISIFSFCFFCCLLFCYLIIVVINWKVIEIQRQTYFHYFKIIVIAGGFTILTVEHMWGLMVDRVGPGKFSIKGEFDYFITWFLFSFGYFIFQALVVVLISIGLQYFQNYRGSKSNVGSR